MKKIPIINQAIKDKKKELKINQVEFANILQKSLSTIKKYDSGGLIPLDTLKIICDKLNLNLSYLITKQIMENKKNSTDYYLDLIKKYSELKNQNKITSNYKSVIEKKETEGVLFYIFRTYYLKDNTKNSVIPHVNYFDGKYYIKTHDDVTLNIFTEKQATELINHFKDYMDFFIFKCQKENLNK